ncbi:hypothetical protein KM043_012254 [Ampulex compressa]|nr:hypothetical protein KM043_012254 [Ampulex compressa]
MEGPVVKLIIRAPNQQIKDQIVDCDIGWTIGRLKEYLSEVYPSKPESANQKLIYSGHLLSDSAHLRDVLRQLDSTEDQAYTVHLVCATKETPVEKIIPKVRTLADARRLIAAQTRSNPTINVQNQPQDTANIMTQHPLTQMYSAQQYFDPHNSQQVAWMRQAYRHYFTQYMQLMVAQGFQLDPSIPYIPQMIMNANDVVQNGYINNINNNAVEEQPQAVAQDGVDINNNGVGEDGAYNQDWLDFFYMLSRIIVLFIVVYFYSSPLRFLIVTFLGFVLYLYQEGLFRVQPILLPENNNGRAENNNQGVQNEAMGAQAAQAQQDEQAPVAQPDARPNANEENEEERPGALAITWTFFTYFFASLIPDQLDAI